MIFVWFVYAGLLISELFVSQNKLIPVLLIGFGILFALIHAAVAWVKIVSDQERFVAIEQTFARARSAITGAITVVLAFITSDPPMVIVGVVMILLTLIEVFWSKPVATQ